MPPQARAWRTRSGSLLFAVRVLCLVALAAVISFLASLLAASAASAEDVFPDGPPLCQANFGGAGGQNATFDVNTNKAFSRADGGAATEHSSHAEVGLGFTPMASFPATVEMGVTYDGQLVGNLGTGTIYGSVHISVVLRDETDGVDLGTDVILDKTQDGAFATKIIEVVASNPFNPPVATFPNVDLLGGHDYSVTLKVVTTAKGLAGESDFKDIGFVSFGCVSVTANLVDSDGDGLFDVWENNGIDVDGDGAADVDLPGFGADPNHKDLFLELDWRTGEEPVRASIEVMKATFAEAPVDAGGVDNPDGLKGINLWVDTGNLMEDGVLVGDDFGGGNEILDPVVCLDDSFYDAKRDNFDPARRVAFRYGILGISPGENECADGSKPGGKGEIGGNDFISYSTDGGYIIHEFGHTLDLRHGGFEHLNNKPNYISMMNYNYDVNIPQFSGGGLVDFSPPLCATCPGGRGAIPADLDETQLDETMVLDPNDPENMFVYRDVLAMNNNGPMSGNDADSNGTPDVDWDGDGVVNNSTVTVDINEDGKCVLPGSDGDVDSTPADDDVLLSDNIIHDGPDRECDTPADPDDVQKRSVGTDQPDILSSYDDWTNMALNFRQFGESADGPINPVPEERSLAETRAQAEANNTTDLEITKSDLPDPVNADENLVYTLTVINHGPTPARGIRVVDTLPSEATYVSDTGGCVEAPAGTLTCELDTVAQGDSTSFDITVVYAAADVADLPAPAIVENEVSVENKVPYGVNGSLGEVGADPDESNNEGAEETTINRPPVSDPNGPYIEECQGTTTDVSLDGSGSFDPDGDEITFEWTTDCPGGSFDDATSEMPTLTVNSPPPCPVACTVTLEVTDPGGLSDEASTDVTIQDTTPPTISVELFPTQLWPPTHGMVDIMATVMAEDICDPFPTVELTSIVSDEPDNAKGNGDGNTVNDVQGADFGTADLEFQLRAERAGSGDGRTYTVTYTATDDCGLSTSASADVFVPLSNSGKASPMEIVLQDTPIGVKTNWLPIDDAAGYYVVGSLAGIGQDATVLHVGEMGDADCDMRAWLALEEKH